MINQLCTYTFFL